MTPSIPAQLADFEILRRLGVGGMAEVFLAKKRGAEGTYKLLVVKRVLPAHGSSRRFRTMFAEEAQLATRLNHPNIVQVYEFQDYGEEGQLLSMEYVEGPDLRRVIREARARHRRIPPYVSAYIVGEVAKGLHYAHERKDEAGQPMEIVHRDVSPQNVLLSFEGSVKIADFGIASANLFREEPGVLKGKTAYMSPEQARGERVDRRTDIYSLGVIFHELLTGRPLHGAAEGGELLEAVRSGTVEPPSMYSREIPSGLESIVMRALARQRDDRFATARDMAATISGALFQQQQPVDTHVLEAVIADLVARDHTSPGVLPVQGTASESQSVREASSASESQETLDTASLLRQRLKQRAGREIRHVALVTVRVHGLEQLREAVGEENGAYFIEQLRRTLDEIAFKRGARLTWEDVPDGARPMYSGTARAVIGLMADPSRSPSDATWFAVDAHEAIHGASEDMPVDLQASLGIVRAVASGRRDSAGHLVHHSLQEGAQELADMLAEQAPASSTWVAGGLYRLVRRDFVWGDAPMLELQGAAERNLPHHIRLHSLLRPLTRDERLREMAHAASDLIGRNAELADLHAALHRISNRETFGGSEGLAARVIYGEMGIGKTALVSTFLSELSPEVRVFRAEGSPARSDLPYSALGEWVSQLTGAHGDSPAAEAQRLIADILKEVDSDVQAADVAVCLAELVSSGAVAAADEADAMHNRRLIATGFRALLDGAAAKAPVVLVLEAAQWCDRQTLEVVSELHHLDPRLPVLLIVVSRPDDKVMTFTEGLVRMGLRPLSMEDQTRLLQTRLGATHGVEQACADVLPRVAGNPFMLLEMVDALLERGALELRERADKSYELLRIDHGDDAGDRLPSTLEQLIADRLSELPPEEQEIIEWLAVAGSPLRQADLVSLLDRDMDEVVTRLCARGLCDRNADTVDVRHTLTREVAYGRLGSSVRTSMHRHLGEHLIRTPMASGLTAAIVARHLARGNLENEAALLYLRAGRAAHSSYQMRLAGRYYRRALALMPAEDEHRFDAHEALEAISRMQGRQRERRRHLKALRAHARESGKPGQVMTAWLRTARMELEAGYLSKARASAAHAEDIARATRSAVAEVQAHSLTADILRDLGDMPGALAAVELALETAASPEVPARLRAEVLRGHGMLLRRVGRVREAVEAHAEAIAVFRQVGSRRLEARAKSSLASAMHVLGRFEDSVALGLESIRIDLAIGGRFQMAETLSSIGQSYASLGDTDRGLVYLRRARQAHERYADQDARADTLLSTAEVLIEAGQIEEATVLVDDASALTAAKESTYDRTHERILRALLSRASGEFEQAVRCAVEARQAAEAHTHLSFKYYAMALEARSRVDTGDDHAGTRLSTAALSDLEDLQGTEHGLVTRALCCEALRAAGSRQADEMQARAAKHVQELLGAIRDEEHRRLFLNRPPVRSLLSPVSPPDA